MHEPDVLTFAVCTFKRVFHPVPVQDRATLGELTQVLTRFELKPEVYQRVQREVRRIEAGWEAWQAGQVVAGKAAGAIRKAAEGASADGGDIEAAARSAYEHLLAEARKGAKRDLRLWSPTLYVPGGRRGSDAIVHLSCLTLDYDDGTPIDDVRDVWSPWFHLLHTTWSHTPERPRLRLTLPLAHPVVAADWPLVWEWAERHCGQPIDPACKGTSRAWALPAVGDRDWPRHAYAHGGDLLDPVLEGLVSEPAAFVSIPSSLEVPGDDGQPSYFRTILAGQGRYLPGDPADEVSPTTFADAPPRGAASGHEPPAAGRHPRGGADPFDEDAFDTWSSFGGVTQGSPPPRPAPEQEAAAAPEPAEEHAAQEVLEDLETLVMQLVERVERLESTSHVDGLERLAALHASGALDESEFRLAKERLLRVLGRY